MQTITAKEAKQHIDAGKALLIDVRSNTEYQQEYIPNAQLIPLDQLQLTQLHLLPQQKIIFHCHSGKRSLMACHKLLSVNPQLDVYSLEGGILAWKAAGFKTVQRAHAKLSLEQQTQLVAGSLVLLGMGLGYTISPLFYLIPTIVGMGLCFAGLTGWCGTTQLLAKLPWNRADKP